MARGIGLISMLAHLVLLIPGSWEHETNLRTDLVVFRTDLFLSPGTETDQETGRILIRLTSTPRFSP
jgi:hypothetical protein